MSVYLSLLVAIIGLIVYLMAEKPKPVEVGRILFWTGVLAFLLRFSTTVNFLKP